VTVAAGSTGTVTVTYRVAPFASWLNRPPGIRVRIRRRLVSGAQGTAIRELELLGPTLPVSEVSGVYLRLRAARGSPRTRAPGPRRLRAATRIRLGGTVTPAARMPIEFRYLRRGSHHFRRIGRTHSTGTGRIRWITWRPRRPDTYEV